jgi:hypothetical protein
MALPTWSIFRHWCQVIGAGLLLSASLSASAGNEAPAAAVGRTLQPLVEKARAGTCVEEPAFMRRNHMKLLQHQRDDTLRGGVRTGKYSLKECVACHASQTSQSVNAEASNFCQSCHNYAAVKIDCFECHANTPPANAPHPLVSENTPDNQPVSAQMPALVAPQQVKP